MVPNLRIVMFFCCLAVLGFAIMSWWVMVYGDAAQKGDIIGTWKNFAVAAFTMWLVRSAPKDPKEIELDKLRVENTSKALDNIGAAMEAQPTIKPKD